MPIRQYIASWKMLSKLPKEIWTLSLTIFINRCGSMAWPFFTLYLTTQRGWSPAEAGGLLFLDGIFGFSGALIAGALTDKISPVIIMRGSLIFSALSLPLIPLSESSSALIIATALWALGTQAYRPAAATMLNLLTPAEDRKLTFSLYRLAINFGWAIGPALGGIIAERSYPALFYINSIALFSGVFVLAKLKSPHRPKRGDLPAESNLIHPYRKESRAFFDTTFLFFLFGIFLVACIYKQHDTVLGLHLAQNLHLSTAWIGLCFAVNAILIVFVEIPLNVWTHHWSLKRSMVLGSLIYAIGFGLLGFAWNFTTVAMLVAFYTFAEMIESPAVHASIAHRAPEHRLGEYTGLLTMTFSLSNSLGPWIGTWLYEHYTHYSVWAFCFLCGTIGAAIFWRSQWLNPHKS